MSVWHPGAKHCSENFVLGNPFNPHGSLFNITPIFQMANESGLNEYSSVLGPFFRWLCYLRGHPLTSRNLSFCISELPGPEWDPRRCWTNEYMQSCPLWGSQVLKRLWDYLGEQKTQRKAVAASWGTPLSSFLRPTLPTPFPRSVSSSYLVNHGIV